MPARTAHPDDPGAGCIGNGVGNHFGRLHDGEIEIRGGAAHKAVANRSADEKYAEIFDWQIKVDWEQIFVYGFDLLRLAKKGL